MGPQPHPLYPNVLHDLTYRLDHVILVRHPAFLQNGAEWNRSVRGAHPLYRRVKVVKRLVSHNCHQFSSRASCLGLLLHDVTSEDIHIASAYLSLSRDRLIPQQNALLANYPNPFNPMTWIPYALAQDAYVTLYIYDVSGRVVRTLDVGPRKAGLYIGHGSAAYWDGRDTAGQAIASGVYFCTIQAGKFSATRKMLMIK